mmetsp:Transcript_101410/g.325872  ORF Transcript_101410/g.325872 Transcript_101410/m.325872 type:complete len:102 (-) Transcript_101410:96-401(-)
MAFLVEKLNCIMLGIETDYHAKNIEAHGEPPIAFKAHEGRRCQSDGEAERPSRESVDCGDGRRGAGNAGQSGHDGGGQTWAKYGERAAMMASEMHRSAAPI